MIRGAIRLALAGAGISYAIDRLLAGQAKGDEPDPIRSSVDIDAPIERVWAVIADVEDQPRWMTDLKSVEQVDDGPIGVGTRFDADVRILGITVADPVTITEFEPPHRYAIRHEGTFTGHGLITLRSSADGATTTVDWEETLIPPALPHLGALVMTPALGAIFQADLGRLKELVETGSVAG